MNDFWRDVLKALRRDPRADELDRVRSELATLRRKVSNTAEAGLLMPPGGEVEWGVRHERFGVDNCKHQEDIARRLVAASGNLTLVRRTLSPWVEVTE